MPNYKLSSPILSWVHNRLRELCDLHNNIVESDFPLTRDEIENAVAPARVRHLLRELRNASVTSVNQTRNLSAIVSGEGVPRDALIYLSLSNEVYYCYEEQSLRYSSMQQSNNYKTLLLDMEVLSEERRGKLVQWVNQAVRERRRATVTRLTVNTFFNKFCESTYELRARWPAMALLFHSSRNRDSEKWEARLREVPRNLNRWRWQGEAWEWRQQNAKAIVVAEHMLMGASLITAKPPASAPVKCEVIDWRRINGEKI